MRYGSCGFPLARRVGWRWVRRLAVVLSLVLITGASSQAQTSLLSEAQVHNLEMSGKVEANLITELKSRRWTSVIAVFEVRDESGLAIDRFLSSNARQALAIQTDRLLATVSELHFKPTHRYSSINAVAGEATADGILQLAAQTSVNQIGAAIVMTGSLDEAIPLAGIKRVRGSGRNGRGVWVAILDTGVDRDHPDIRRALKKGECFCLWCCGPNLENRGSGKRSVEDDSGHGTLVSGIVVSRGKVAPRGIARNAKLLAMRVGEDIFGFDLFLSSDVLSGLDWIIVNMPQVRVVNMSFGGGGYKGKCDKKGAENRAYATAIDTLWDLGIMVFAATGNEGRKNRIVTPACIDKAIAVGAVYDEDLGPMSWPRCRDETTAADQVTCFSDSNRHVDLVAPGAMITGPYLRGAVTTAAGTSLASPMAAGCAVLLRSKYPEATPAEVLEALESSSTLVTDSKNGRGYTSLDCEESFAYLERLLK